MNWHDRRHTAEAHDHERDLRKHEPRPGDITPSQYRAIAGLIVTCEVLCESGILTERVELQVREKIAEALTAFGLSAANRDERIAQHVLDMVGREMARG